MVKSSATMSNGESQNLEGLIKLITELQKTIQVLTAKLEKYEMKNDNLADTPRISTVPTVPMPGSSGISGLGQVPVSGFPTLSLNLNPGVSATDFQWKNYSQNTESHAGRILSTNPYPKGGKKSKMNEKNKRDGSAQIRGPYDPAKDRNNVAFYKNTNEKEQQPNTLSKTNDQGHTKKRFPSDNIGGAKKKTIESDNGESDSSTGTSTSTSKLQKITDQPK